MLRFSARAGLGLAALTVSAATLTLAQPPAPGGPPTGQPAADAAAASAILDFASIQNHWHWLRRNGEEVQLLTSDPDRPSLSLTSMPGLTELALEEENIWLLKREGSRGSLLKLPRTGGAATVVLSNLETPGGLFAAQGRVFWVETHAPAVPGLLTIPAADSRNVVRMLAKDGTVSDLGTMAGGSAAANGDLEGTADLLGVRLRRLGSTEFYLIDLRQPKLQRVAVEEGAQQGVVHQGGFVWTAQSEESSDPSYQRCLRRSLGNGRTASITDWLPATGQLMRLGTRLYYGEMDLYRIPEGGGEATYVADLPPGEITSDGERVVHIDPRSGPKSVPLTATKP